MQDVPLSAVCLLSVLGVASFLVLLLAAVRLWHRLPILPAVEKPQPRVQWISLLLVLAWVGMQLLALTAELPDTGRKATIESVQATCLLNSLMFLAVFIPMTYPGGSHVEEFGFHLDNWRRQIAEGFLGFAASIIPVIAAWTLTLPWRSSENQHGLLQLLEQDQSATTLLWIVLAAVVLAPIVEELIYRVILQTWLQQKAPPREALVAVAVVFAAVHRLPDAIPLLPLALVLGYVYQQRRCFLTVVLIHMLFNAANLALALLTLS